MSKAISKPSNILVAVCGLILFVAITYVSGVSFHPNNVEAQTSTPVPVTGHAWSDTIGWIEFQHNKTNKVTIDSAGYFQGYAWSDNIGWLKFDKSLAGPGGGAGAQVVNDKVIGWARFCAGQTTSPTTNPNNTCTGASRTDGWDGWLKFDHGKTGEVTYNQATKKFEGFAWGSDVVGWVDMKLVGADLSVDEPVPLSASCSADPSSLGSSGGSVNFRASASGGSGSYTYKWDNDKTTVSFTESISKDTTHDVEISDGVTTKTASCSVNVDDVSPPTKYKIIIKIIGTGSGGVTGDMICNSGECQKEFTAGTDIKLEALEGGINSNFVGWSSTPNVCSGTNSSCDFRLNSSVTITVNFNELCTENCGGQVSFEVTPRSIVTNCANLNCDNVFYSPSIIIQNQTAAELRISIPNNPFSNIINVSPQSQIEGESLVESGNFVIPVGKRAAFRWKFNSRLKTDSSIDTYNFTVTGNADGFSEKVIPVTMRYIDVTQTPQ